MDNKTPPTAQGVAQRRRTGGSEPEGTSTLALYLRDIGTVPLLAAEDEVRLAREIEAGVLAEERLGRGGEMTNDDRAELETLSSRAGPRPELSSSRTSGWWCVLPGTMRGVGCRCSISSRRATSG